MAVILYILIGALLAGIIVFSLISYYSISRSAKYFILLIMFALSIVVLVISILFLIQASGDSAVVVAAIAIWAVIAAFWIKTPLQILRD